jgi:hypothetical protein
MLFRPPTAVLTISARGYTVVATVAAYPTAFAIIVATADATNRCYNQTPSSQLQTLPERSFDEQKRSDETYLERLARSVVVDDKLVIAIRVLLTVLHLAIDL